MLAYLVIREGTKWSDVFRLVPGQTVTIGRAPTNQIVLTDERCSRAHAEVFLADGQWVVRDLDSRNGTTVGSEPVRGDRSLVPGEVIRVGRSQLAFVTDLSKAFASDGDGELEGPLANPDLADLNSGDSHVLAAQESATITHRRGQTRYLDSQEPEDEGGISRVGRAAAKLARLAFRLAKAGDGSAVAELALDGLFAGTQGDSGGIYLLPRDYRGEPNGDKLEMLASRTESELPYYRVPSFLAETVLRENEAVLARNVMGDSALARRDSQGEIHATSVVCAPIRVSRKAVGIVHLYSTNADRLLEPEDLEFSLAVADTAAVALENLNRRQELAENLNKVQDENVKLRQRLGVQTEIVGTSPVVARITEEIARAAPSKATVLIRGESGVGKELVARAVHYNSPRKNEVFVCLNCAALSESLLESELFGHEKGAFTGATDRKAGKFETAHKGTLMLDEIGEMSPTIQAKFLRVLEGHPFERVGGSQSIKVDVRVIAATNRDLEKAVTEGQFRRDLYFRLHVLEIFVPALRKRPEDIQVLANYFLQKFIEETGRRIRGFTPEAVEQLNRYRWPGNVRELRNVIERAVVLCQQEYIDRDDLMLSRLGTAGDTSEFPASEMNQFVPMSLQEVERRHIEATLNSTGWNKSQAANILGIERSTLDRKIRRYELADDRRVR